MGYTGGPYNFDPVFDPADCEVPAVQPIEVIPDITNCELPDPPEAIFDCDASGLSAIPPVDLAAAVSGAAGPQGSQGVPGLNGLNGVAGPQGAQGASGAVGINGAAVVVHVTTLIGGEYYNGTLYLTHYDGSTWTQDVLDCYVKHAPSANNLGVQNMNVWAIGVILGVMTSNNVTRYLVEVEVSVVPAMPITIAVVPTGDPPVGTGSGTGVTNNFHYVPTVPGTVRFTVDGAGEDWNKAGYAQGDKVNGTALSNWKTADHNSFEFRTNSFKAVTAATLTQDLTGGGTASASVTGGSSITVDGWIIPSGAKLASGTPIFVSDDGKVMSWAPSSIEAVTEIAVDGTDLTLTKLECFVSALSSAEEPETTETWHEGTECPEPPE